MENYIQTMMVSTKVATVTYLVESRPTATAGNVLETNIVVAAAVRVFREGLPPVVMTARR